MNEVVAPAMPRDEAERLLAECELHRLLGLEFVEWAHGVAVLRFAPPAFARAPTNQSVHGGALATALDTAACFAVIAAVGVDCSTVDLRTDFLRPATDGEFVVRGTLLRAGRRFAFADAAVLNRDDKICATARGTFTW